MATVVCVFDAALRFPGRHALAALGHLALIPGVASLPQHLAYLAEDLVDGIDGPDHIQMLIFGDDLAMNDIDTRDILR